MARMVLVAGAAAAFLLASMSAGEVWAQRGGTTGGLTGGAGGQTRGGTGATGLGGAQAFGQAAGGGLAGLATGYGGVGGQQAFGGGLQNRNLTQGLLNQNRGALTTQNTQNLQTQVPLRLQVPVASVRPATIGPAVAVSARLSRIMTAPARQGLAAPVAMWEGEVLVLGGTVANESVRRQIEGIALLEPGVRTVRNEMVVGPVPVATSEGN